MWRILGVYRAFVRSESAFDFNWENRKYKKSKCLTIIAWLISIGYYVIIPIASAVCYKIWQSVILTILILFLFWFFLHVLFYIVSKTCVVENRKEQ